MNAKNNRVKTNRQTKCSAHQCQTCRATQSFLQMPISGEGLPWIPPSAIIDISATVVLMFWCAQATSMLRQCWMRTQSNKTTSWRQTLAPCFDLIPRRTRMQIYHNTHIYIHTSVYTIKRLDHRTDCPSHSVGLCARAKCKGVFRGNGLGHPGQENHHQNLPWDCQDHWAFSRSTLQVLLVKFVRKYVFS